MFEQILVLIVIVSILYLFVKGSIRYEYVSFAGLIILTISGILSPEEAFKGFSHPAVITVASVLVISQALIKSGVIERLVDFINRITKSFRSKLIGLMLVTAFLSSFMNNIGALALILPVGLKVAHDNEISPSALLMPIAFSSLMGGMVSLIGTPPNLIVSNYRMEALGKPFEFFDFSPLGLTVVFFGIGFIGLIGYKLIPQRSKREEDRMVSVGDYLSELVVPEDSSLINMTIKELFIKYKADVEILSIIRDKRSIIAPGAGITIYPNDHFIIKASPQSIRDFIQLTGLKLKGAKLDYLESQVLLESDDIVLREVIIREDSLLIGRTAFGVKLRNRYNTNLIAVYRKGQLSMDRLKDFVFQRGDILLLQISSGMEKDTYSKLGLLPLATSADLDIKAAKSFKDRYTALILFVLAIGLTSLGFLPVQTAFSAVAISLAVSKILSPREFYRAIEWPSIILLASLLPLGSAIESSGLANTIANGLIKISGFLSPNWIMIILMLITITITNLISSTATAILMSPIAISLALSMDVNPDPLLMGVCLASSAAFLTPIGHQSNMLVMGPGGYKFQDYWKLGLPLSILVMVLGPFVILRIWSF